MILKIFAQIQKNKKNLYMQHKPYESVPFGILLAIVGGFLDAYTFVGRGGVFANAQTGNIVFLGVYAAKGEWQQALVHVPPIFAFILGVIVAASIKKNSIRLFIPDWTRAILFFEIIVLIIIGFIPDTTPNIIVTVIVSFVASIQVSAFRKLVDSPYSTTMSTGNLRSASKAAYIAFTQKDRKAAIRSIRFFAVVLSFLFGAFLGGLLTIYIGVKAIWSAAVILALAVVLFSSGELKN